MRNPDGIDVFARVHFDPEDEALLGYGKPGGTHPAGPRGLGGRSSSLRRGQVRRRLVCLLAALHAEPSLYGVLIKELSREMTDIRFTIADQDDTNVIWLCGYERGAADHVGRMRRTHPCATVIVTGRGPVELWSAEALSAGADRACSWPVNYEELSRFLHQRHSEPGPLSSGLR